MKNYLVENVIDFETLETDTCNELVKTIKDEVLRSTERFYHVPLKLKVDPDGNVLMIYYATFEVGGLKAIHESVARIHFSSKYNTVYEKTDGSIGQLQGMLDFAKEESK